MSFLVPLYLAGLAALSLPFLFHLVRRTPRGRQDFSSLMFLSPTPPRLTRRSRLDQLLLLALRLAALALLAFAFARPFLREAAALSPESLTGRRVAILIDTSASMQRGDLWPQAVSRVERELNELNPQDDVALYAFSDRLTTVVDFEREKEAPGPGKPQIVKQQLHTLKPTWGGSDLGTALTTVAGEIDSATDARQSPLEPQIVVVSDFQKGSRIEALQAFEWPPRVPVVLRAVAPKKNTNATLHVLHGEEEGDDDAVNVRVRVVNAADSASDQFYVIWAGSPGKSRPEEIGVYVPAGQSRVVRLPRNANSQSADRIVLRGDDHDFDNTFYVVPPVVQPVVVLYLGVDGADDAQGSHHYLKLAVTNDALRTVTVRTPATADAPPELGDPAPQLIVASQTVSPEWEPVLRRYVEEGGLLLLVPADQASAASLPAIFDDLEIGATPKGSDRDYLLLGDINFAHPLFAPFASPRYSDFTKIHFWKHRRVSLKTTSTTTVVARFDNGDPALLERPFGKGRMLALTSGWQPDDSQLALSSKFVPFMGGLLDLACGSVATPASVSIGASVPLPPPFASNTIVRKPDGREIPLPADARTFTETDQPGIYRVTSGTTETRFAVNLAAAESDTAPLNAEQLEQRGVRFGTGLTRAERIERVRQQRDTELESRQKVWHWLIAAALGVLAFETWWAGRAERKIIQPTEVA